MKDRLIELITDIENKLTQAYPYTTDTFRIVQIADYLLENGVLVPPCKVGDTVYMPWEYKGIECIALLTVTHIIIDSEDSYIKTDFDTDDNDYWELFNGGKFYFGELNKRFFLTREAAEQALKGGV